MFKKEEKCLIGVFVLFAVNNTPCCLVVAHNVEQRMKMVSGITGGL